MSFTNELIGKAREAASAEELLKLAKAEGFDITAEEAGAYYSFLSGSRELTAEELAHISGGKGGDPNPLPKYKIDQPVARSYVNFGVIRYGTVIRIERYQLEDGWLYDVLWTIERSTDSGRIRSINEEACVFLETDPSVIR